ncbi:MAG: sigma-70 family RNA polymerase sigma factor [Clostridia bacterium]|nr:sigma-70 family RNA polymerase sigma factor [Clostridia bacterium]
MPFKQDSRDPTVQDEIIALYQARDERAIQMTADTLGAYCHTIAYNILGNREDAEECVSDAYLTVWNAIPPAEPTSLRSFVTRIVRNLALNRYKEQHRDKRGGGQVPLALEELADVVSGEDDVVADYERREMLTSISDFLTTRSTRDRGIFLDRYLHLDSTADLANRYGIKEAQVLLILSRTRKKLKEHLEKEGYTL